MALKKRGEEWEEDDNAVQWMVLTVVISLVLTIVLAIVALPLGYLVGTGISKDSMNEAWRFIQTIFADPAYLFSRYGMWFRQLSGYHGRFATSCWLQT